MSIEFLFFLPFLLVPLLVLFVLGRVLLNSAKRTPEEQNKKPIFEGRFSARVGSIYYRGPLTRFSVYEDMIVVASTKTYVLKPGEIAALRAGKRLWLDIIKIEHNRSDYPILQIGIGLNDTLRNWARSKGISSD